jgi:hypothetical protein
MEMDGKTEIRVKDKPNGFKTMAEIYRIMHVLKLHWNDKVDIRKDGRYVVVEFAKNDEKQD